MSDEDKVWFPKCEKALYTPLFLNPDGRMVSWLIVDYYAAARSIVERILQRETLDGDILRRYGRQSCTVLVSTLSRTRAERHRLQPT